MVDNTIALQVKPLDIATPLMQAAKMRQMESEQQMQKQASDRDEVASAMRGLAPYADSPEFAGRWSQTFDDLGQRGVMRPDIVARMRGTPNVLAMQSVLQQYQDPKLALQERQLAETTRQHNTTIGMQREQFGETQKQHGIAQANTDRSFTEGVRQFDEAQKTKNLPPGWVRSPDGGMDYVPRGPADPKYIEASTGAKDTPESKNYIDYAADEVARGREPMSRLDYITKLKQAGAISITNDMRGENEFSKVFGGVEAKRWGGYITDGEKADRAMVDITNLRDISQRMGSQGARANVKEALGPYAEALGINIAGLDDIQAFSSVIQRLAPQQRALGSGSTSDIEYKGMLKSLPGLSLNPAARGAIIDTMEALSRHDQTQRDIAVNLSTGELTRVQAEKAMRALPDPMAGFKKWRTENPELYQSAVKAAPPQASSGRISDAFRDVDQAKLRAMAEDEMRRRGLLK